MSTSLNNAMGAEVGEPFLLSTTQNRGDSDYIKVCGHGLDWMCADVITVVRVHLQRSRMCPLALIDSYPYFNARK
jgi:hypothetical protein